MLLTNGSAASREMYANDFLSTLTCLPFQGAGRLPMGIAYITVRTRFAGMHNPTVSLSNLQPTLKWEECEP